MSDLHVDHPDELRSDSQGFSVPASEAPPASPDEHPDLLPELNSAAPGLSTPAGEAAAEQTDELTDLLPELMIIARSLAPRGIDPEDLLADAMTRLLARQQQHPFEVEHPKAYLATTMRNLVLDFHRSPRSRVDAHDDTFFHTQEDESPVGTHRVRAAELHREFEIVTRAFEQLPEETRMLLEELLLNGRAPGEVGEQLGLGASAVALRLFRAKAGLKREVLVQHLRRGGEECRANAERIAAPVELEPELHKPRQRGIKHVLECGECRRNWGGFAAMAQAFGIAPLVVLVNSGEAPAVALAAVGGVATGAQGDGGSTGGSGLSAGDGVLGTEGATSNGAGGSSGAGGSAGGAGSEGMAGGTGGGAAGAASGGAAAAGANTVAGGTASAAGAASTGAAVGGGSAASAAGAAGAAAGAGTAASAVGGGMVAAMVAAAGFGATVLRVLTSPVTTMVWAGSLVIGSGVAVTHFAAGQAEALPTTGERRVLAADEQLDARFAAAAEWLNTTGATGTTGTTAGAGTDRAAFALSFDIADVSGWRVEELTVALPVGSTLITAPVGCEADGPLIRCAGLAADWRGDSFEVAIAATGEGGSSTVEQRQFAAWITVTTDREIELHGTAERVLEELVTDI